MGEQNEPPAIKKKPSPSIRSRLVGDGGVSWVLIVEFWKIIKLYRDSIGRVYAASYREIIVEMKSLTEIWIIYNELISISDPSIDYSWISALLKHLVSCLNLDR